MFLQMRRQSIRAALGAAALAGAAQSCTGRFAESAEGVAVAGVAAAQDLEPADVVLRGVAFVRVADGRIAARGTAAEASFRQAGGKVEATRLAVDLPPGAHAPEGLAANPFDAHPNARAHQLAAEAMEHDLLADLFQP